MRITKEKIVQAAIEQLREGGIDSLRMRSLAARLQVKAPTLYWHIRNKEELYMLIAESICAHITPAWDMSEPTEYLKDIYRQYRQELRSIRDAAQIFAAVPPRSELRAAMTQDAILCLEALGVAPEHSRAAGQLLNNYVLSFVMDELRLDEGERDAEFLYGLEVLFSGFEAQKNGGS